VRGPQQMFFICWGARPARNEREARKCIGQSDLEKTARLRRVAGRTPAFPAEELIVVIKLTQDQYDLVLPF
jgi:hypothetical protein